MLSTHATQYNGCNKTKAEYSDRLESNPDGPGDGWMRGYLQQGQPRKLEGSDGDLADAVPAESQHLQGGAQVVQCSQLQRADFVIVQVPERNSTSVLENHLNYNDVSSTGSTHRSFIWRPAGKLYPLSSVMSLLLKSRVSTDTSGAIRLPSIVRILL